MVGRFRKLLYVGTSSVIGLAFCAGARAQTVAPPDQAHTVVPRPVHSGSARAPAPVVARQQGLEEVVVTAQKRSERLEKIPLAVTAFSSKTLKALSIDRSEDLPVVTPGIRVENQIGYALLSIRGIGNFIVTAGAESDVAVYVDGVYQNNLYGGLQDFVDLSSIEVLKGPQGTLYGRNAVAGVFNISTINPSLDVPKGKIEATVGNYNLRRVEGYGSVPLIPGKLAAIVSGSYEDRDSYQTNVNPGGPQPRSWVNATVRGKLLYQPLDELRVVLAADFQDKKDSSSAFGQAQDNAFGYAFAGSQPSGLYHVNLDHPAYTQTQKGGVSLTGDAKLGSIAGLGDISVTSITAYRYARAIAVVDNDATPFNLFDFNQNVAFDRTFTQELRIQNSGERFSWMVGGFYYNDKPGINLFLISDILPINGLINGRINRDSYSGFTQETYKITNRLSLTGGIRYTVETDKLLEQSFTLPTGQFIPSPNVGKQDTWDSFTYHVSLDYDFGPVLAYASVSTGFKSGAFNLTDESDTNAVSPEKIQSYEVGVKGNLFDRKVLYTLAAFWEDYSNLQVQIVNASNGATQTQNAATARTRGVEGDIRGRVTDALTLSAGFTAIDPRFVSFPNYSAITANPPGTPPSPNLTSTLDVSGNQLPYASRFSENIGANYHAEFQSFGTVDFAANLYRTSRFYGSPQNQAIESQAGYWDLGGSITVVPDALKKASLRLFIKNATNTHRYGYIQTENFGTVFSPAAPLTFGATLGYSF